MPKEEQPKLEIFSGGGNLNLPPKPHELEISIFGPGYGECIVVHLGHDNWFIVDSCIDIFTREPVALAYFEKLNIDPSASVRQIIATHWHDDHIRGFGKLLHACSSAQLVLSNALRFDEFNQLIECFGTATMIDSSGLDEFHKVLSILRDRKKNGIQHHIPVFAIQSRRIWDGFMETFGNAPLRCEMVSLSPSDSAVLASKLEFAKLIPKVSDPKRWVPPITPNRAAVVLWLRVGNFSVLLGADLEESGDPKTGWSVIVNSHSPQDGRASIFKVPHHGSLTAHNPGVWEEMLTGEPIAVLTPFQRGSASLPAKDDLQRLASLTQNAFATCGIKNRIVKRDRTVEKTIKNVAGKISVLDGFSGHVRIRFKTPGEGTVELFGDAQQLKSPSVRK